ncbi:MAG: hypothetical protein ABI686_03715 [Acidobacteriota bacterium]
MKEEYLKEIPEVTELPDSWWYRVYLGVIISNILVILALGTFAYYFSS